MPAETSVNEDGVRCYVLLNKPRGVLTAKRRDPSNMTLPTVTELLASSGFRCPERVSPVGRLDVESEGLLLLTDDGRLTGRMIHPAYGCRKKYLAVTRGYGRPSARSRFTAEMCACCVKDGVLLRPASVAPYRAQPLEMELIPYAAAEAAMGGSKAVRHCLGELLVGVTPADDTLAAEEAELDFVTVVLTEGKKHEVRLLLRSYGFATMRLVRIAHGPLCDPELLVQPGAWRELCGSEREELLRIRDADHGEMAQAFFYGEPVC